MLDATGQGGGGAEQEIGDRRWNLEVRREGE